MQERIGATRQAQQFPDIDATVAAFYGDGECVSSELLCTNEMLGVHPGKIRMVAMLNRLVVRRNEPVHRIGSSGPRRH